MTAGESMLEADAALRQKRDGLAGRKLHREFYFNGCA
jgi:hypothetical protein